MSRKPRQTKRGKQQHEQAIYEDEFKPYIKEYAKPVPITGNHNKYHQLLKSPNKKIVLCDGWAGCGKTIVSIWYACQALKRNKIDSIVIMRSLEGLGKDSGAYPGGPLEKNEPKLRQVMMYISSFLQCDIRALIASGVVQVQGLADVQGMDLTGCWLHVTEAQTLTPKEMYAVVTRGAEKVILEGDTCPAQLTKNVRFKEDGLTFLIDNIGDEEEVGIVTMTETTDIVRQDYLKNIIPKLMVGLENIS